MDFEQLLHKLDQSDHDPYSPHILNFYLILVVSENIYTHFVDFKSYTLEKGSTLFVAKNQVHHFNQGLEHAKGYAVVFNHLFVDTHYFLTDNFRLNRLFNFHIEGPVIHQEEMGQDSLIGLMAHIHFEYQSSSTFAKSEIIAAILRILLLKAERAKELEGIVHVNTHWLETFGKFKDMLEKSYMNTRNSRTYAAELLVSYKFLNDIVKKLTGKTVKTFIDDFVTIEIKRYLISTSLTVNDFSYKTGFEEPSNMIKFFKKNAGMTPLKFRLQL